MSVLEPPTQIDVGDAVAVTVTDDPTDTVTEAVFEQPLAFVPVTE